MGLVKLWPIHADLESAVDAVLRAEENETAEAGRYA